MIGICSMNNLLFLAEFLVWFALHQGPFWQTVIVSMWLSNSWGTSLEIFVFDFQLVGVVPAYVPDINACSNTQTPSLATKT